MFILYGTFIIFVKSGNVIYVARTTYIRPTVYATHVCAQQQRQLRHAAVGNRLRLLWHAACCQRHSAIHGISSQSACCLGKHEDALLDHPCSADTGDAGSELAAYCIIFHSP
eukprot:scaffold103515_cov30-Prasinocladus_malaysianus.AAC.1